MLECARKLLDTADIVREAIFVRRHYTGDAACAARSRGSDCAYARGPAPVVAMFDGWGFVLIVLGDFPTGEVRLLGPRSLARPQAPRTHNGETWVRRPWCPLVENRDGWGSLFLYGVQRNQNLSKMGQPAIDAADIRCFGLTRSEPPLHTVEAPTLAKIARVGQPRRHHSFLKGAWCESISVLRPKSPMQAA